MNNKLSWRNGPGRAFQIVLAGFLLSLCAGCGGGGGGGGGGGDGGGDGGSETASVRASQSSIEVRRFALVDELPSASINFTVSNLAASGTYTVVDWSAYVLNSASVGTPNGNDAYTLFLNFKSPITLGPGRRTDTVSIKVCSDRACTQQISGSPLVFEVIYNVEDLLIDGDGNRLKVVGIEANDLLWSATLGKFLVSTPSTAENYPNSILTLDPVTGQLDSPVLVGGEPDALALSKDGSFAFVALTGNGSIERFAMPALTSRQSIHLGTAWDGRQWQAREIHVSPVDATTIAVLRAPDNETDSYHGNVLVIDDVTPRANSVGYSQVPAISLRLDSIQWGSADDVIFALNGNEYPGSVHRLAVTPNGVQYANSVPGILSSFADDIRMHFDGRYLYADAGGVFDTHSQAIKGYLNTVGVVRVWPDATSMRLYGYVYGMAPQLIKCDLDTLAPLGSLRLPTTINYGQVDRLQRWGARGLAFTLNRTFRSKGVVVFVDGPFVN